MYMEFKCSICGHNKFDIKNVNLPVRDVKVDKVKNIFLELLPVNSQMFYLRICLNCGKTELYYSAILNKEQEKKKSENY